MGKDAKMTLRAIQDRIIEVLKTRTVDDFYAESHLDFAKDEFLRLTGLKTNAEIDRYLESRFPETVVEKFILELEKEIKDVESSLAVIPKTLKKSEAEHLAVESEIVKIDKAKQEIPSQIRTTKLEIEEIEKEITVITPLATKSPYDKQVEGLKQHLETKSAHLASFPALKKQLNNEYGELKKKANTLSEETNRNRKELGNLKGILAKKQQELEVEKKGEGSKFAREFAALKFLFLVLLMKKLTKEEIMQATGDYKEEYVNGRWGRVPVRLPTGDFQLVRSDATLEDVARCVVHYIGTSSLQPKNWRKIVDALFLSQLPKFSGTIGNYLVYNNHILKRLPLELSVSDVSTMLALKAAIRTSPAIKTEERGIVIGLSGGLFASIIFREKGTVIAKFQEKALEIFVNQLKSKDRLMTETLYHQAGYAKGVINIEIPAGYYILSSDYVIEIHFNASAILLNQNHMAAFSHDVSSEAKRDSDDRDDEMRRQQAAWDYDDD